MSKPDMRHCVQYALTHPYRTYGVTEELDLFSLGKLTFAKPDVDTFSLLKLATDAISIGGAVPGVLNFANEVAVAAFLNREISFMGIFELVEKTVDHFKDCSNIKDIDEIISVCDEAQIYAKKLITDKAVR